jgi:hypothetical protein
VSLVLAWLQPNTALELPFRVGWALMLALLCYRVPPMCRTASSSGAMLMRAAVARPLTPSVLLPHCAVDHVLHDVLRHVLHLGRGESCVAASLSSLPHPSPQTSMPLLISWEFSLLARAACVLPAVVSARWLFRAVVEAFHTASLFGPVPICLVSQFAHFVLVLFRCA